MAKQTLILEKSAIGIATKKATLFQEGMRRLRNCSLELSWGSRRYHLNRFVWQMYLSGYQKPFILNIIKGCLNRYKQMLVEDTEGSNPLWRSREMITTHKAKKPGRTASSWFMRGDTRQNMCLPVTPGGQLVRMLRSELGSFKGPDRGTTKFTERAGLSI